MDRFMLTCNAGSTNVKLAAFTQDGRTKVATATTARSAEAVQAWTERQGLTPENMACVVHRVVHGGPSFHTPLMLTPSVTQALAEFIPLAPLHQPPALALMDLTAGLFPHARQAACFDTAFHAGLPLLEQMTSLPKRYREKGIRRYGFHGLSYQHVARTLPSLVGEERARGPVLAAHLGGGSSACAMVNLESRAVTMGFSALDGLMMSTRCGALDPGVLLYLLQHEGMTPETLAHFLYHECGLKGLSGLSGDMKTLLESDSPDAALAVQFYCRTAAERMAALTPATGAPRVLVFTGGIGEHAAPVREAIIGYLRPLFDMETVVITADEEAVMAESAAALMAASD